MPARESFRSWTLSVERWAFSSEIAPSHGTTARISNADEAVAAAKELGAEVVIKIQAWTTGRAGIGGVAFAKKPMKFVRMRCER